jgi:glycosyltransferase involved in cell wall biosynthesis
MSADSVDIVTRTKDRPILVKRSIESVLNQSHQNWFHVIINDGGDIETLEMIISKYADIYRDRLKLIHNPSSVGAGPALNVGMKASNSEYIVTHDDDDSWVFSWRWPCAEHRDEGI